MRKIAFINGKGGSGKTTAAAILLLALRDAGKQITIRDTDPQRTFARFAETLEIETTPDDPAFEIIDTPPRLDHKLLGRIADEVDRIIIPARPGPADLWTAQETAEFLREIGAAKKARLLWNCVRPGTLLSRDLDDKARQIGLKAIMTPLSLRESYQHAFLVGWTGLDAEAKDEARRMAEEII